tara:strand:- start:161 stop:592 length:432 start_codon:yes stop_codon:yes gene_type:complete
MKQKDLILYAVLLLFSLMFFSKATAKMKTTAELLKDCKGAVDAIGLTKAEIREKNYSTIQMMKMSQCMTYFDGVKEGGSLQSIIDKKTTKAKFFLLGSCPPRELFRNQMMKIFVKYVDNHPEKLTNIAITTISESLEKAFPCK